MSAYYPQGGMSSKRLIILGIIIAFHAVIIYAFATGLVQNGKRLVQTILQTSIIQTQKTQELPPPPPKADLKVPPPVTVVAPDVAINIPAPPPPIHVAPPPPPPAPKPIVHAPPAPIVLPRPTYAPDPNDYYPDAARRNNEEGRALVNICVNTRGRVTSAKIGASSGHPMLDEAALKLAKAYRFKAATQGGKPVADCLGLPVHFVLTGG